MDFGRVIIFEARGNVNHIDYKASTCHMTMHALTDRWGPEQWTVDFDRLPRVPEIGEAIRRIGGGRW